MFSVFFYNNSNSLYKKCDKQMKNKKGLFARQP